MLLKTLYFKIFISLLLIASWTTFINTPVSHAAIRTVTGTVTKVSDGDSIQITTAEQTKLKVRLYGIDAPETPKISHRTGQVSKPGQPHGDESWKALENKIMGKQVKLEILDIDKYRRMVGMVWLDDRNINLEMVSEGHAEAFIEYLKPAYRTQFFDAEREAKSARRGVWSLPNYERPRAFRKRLKVSGGE
ncbi:MAG: nuclease [Spirochaetae bacterium HGW-Spirochaetae-5]|nr:MAG: nuclease [Spirochaetae bacterium HGW-Spirochaetae-5]